MASWSNTLIQGILLTTNGYRIGEQGYNLANLVSYNNIDNKKLEFGDSNIISIETYGEEIVLPSKISMPVSNDHTNINSIFEYNHTDISAGIDTNSFPYCFKIGNAFSVIDIITGRMYISNNYGYYIDLFGTNYGDLNIKSYDINTIANNINLNLSGSISANNYNNNISIDGDITVDGKLLVTGDESEFTNIIKMRNSSNGVSYNLVQSKQNTIDDMHEFIFGDSDYGDKFTINTKKFIINDRNIRKNIISANSNDIIIGNEFIENLEMESRNLNINIVQGGSASINADDTISLTTKGPTGYYSRNMVSVMESTATSHKIQYGTYESSGTTTEHVIRGKNISLIEKYTTPIFNINKNGVIINSVTDTLSSGKTLLESSVDKFSANIVYHPTISNGAETKNIILGKFENGIPSIDIGDADSNVHVTTPVFVAGRSEYIGPTSQDEMLPTAPFKLDNNNIQLGYTNYTRNVDICGDAVNINIINEAKLYFDDNNKISFANNDSNKKLTIKTGSIENEVGSIYNELSGGYTTKSNGGTIQIIASGNTGNVVLNSGKNLVMSSAGNSTIESSNMIANKSKFYVYTYNNDDTDKYSAMKIDPSSNITEIYNNYGKFGISNTAIYLASNVIPSSGNSLGSAYMQIKHENDQGSSDLIMQAGSSVYIKMHSANTTNSQGTSISRVIDINAPHLRLTSNDNNIISYTGLKDLYVGNYGNCVHIDSYSNSVSLNSKNPNITTTATDNNVVTAVFSSNSSNGTTIQSVAHLGHPTTSSVNLNNRDITIDADKLVFQLKKLIIENLNAIQTTMVGNTLPDVSTATEGQIFFKIT